jgi:C-terminal processing protease CtpA/Prc
VGSRVEIAGLRKGARILTVDGRKVSGPSDAKRSLLGTIGTVVMLEVSDNPDGSDPYTIVVQRERIP